MPNKFEQYQPLALPKTPGIPFKEASKETPAFTTEAIKVAIALPLGAGLVIFISVLSFAIGVNWSPAWRPAAAIAGLVMFGLGVYWAIQGAEGVMWQSEKIIGQDLNSDGYIGQPPQPRHLLIQSYHEGRSGFDRHSFTGIPENDRVLIEWIDDALSGRSLAIEKWEPLFGHTYPNGIKTSNYMMFKACAEKNDFILSRGSHGIVLTGKGRREFSNILEELKTQELPMLPSGEDNELGNLQ